MAIIADIIQGVLGAGYNLFTNARDFEYQKHLQQEMFEREDTAVQRRMTDLEAAGLNPNLAAGSAANAGSVVARSNTNDVDFGSILDMKMHEQQIKNQKIEEQILKAKKEQEDLRTNEAKLSFYGRTGLLNGVTYNFDDSQRPVTFWLKDGINTDFWNTPYGKLLDYEMNYGKNSAAFMEKQNNWFTTKMVSDLVFDSIGAGMDILKPNFMKGGKR